MAHVRSILPCLVAVAFAVAPPATIPQVIPARASLPTGLASQTAHGQMSQMIGAGVGQASAPVATDISTALLTQQLQGKAPMMEMGSNWQAAPGQLRKGQFGEPMLQPFNSSSSSSVVDGWQLLLVASAAAAVSALWWWRRIMLMKKQNVAVTEMTAASSLVYSTPQFAVAALASEPFDPLGLSQNSDFQKPFATEIRHGRVALLANRVEAPQSSKGLAPVSTALGTCGFGALAGAFDFAVLDGAHGEKGNDKVARAAALAQVTALASVAALPQSALAIVSEDDDGFDLRILLVLGFPATALTWALFNVWRVAFRQTVRLGEGLDGSSKIGLRPED